MKNMMEEVMKRILNKTIQQKQVNKQQLYLKNNMRTVFEKNDKSVKKIHKILVVVDVL